MKQMFTLLAALLAFTALFAQRNDRYKNDLAAGQFSNRTYSEDDRNQRPDRAITWQENDERWQADNRMNRNDRHAATDENYREDDRSRDDCGIGRSNNRWRHNYSKDELTKERAGKLTAFGGGVLAGGILAILLSTHR